MVWVIFALPHLAAGWRLFALRSDHSCTGGSYKPATIPAYPAVMNRLRHFKSVCTIFWIQFTYLHSDSIGSGFRGRGLSSILTHSMCMCISHPSAIVTPVTEVSTMPSARLESLRAMPPKRPYTDLENGVRTSASRLHADDHRVWDQRSSPLNNSN